MHTTRSIRMLNFGAGGDKKMVYVDDAEVKKHGYTWFHLMADSIQELHAFAARIGLDSRAFHRQARHPHYDVTEAQRHRAIRFGARSITAREAVMVGRRMEREAPSSPSASSHQLCLFV